VTLRSRRPAVDRDAAVNIASVPPQGVEEHDADTGSDQLVEAVLRLMPDAALVVDAEGQIVAVNPGAESMFGYGRGGLTGVPVETLVPERLRAEHAALRSTYLATPAPRSMGTATELWATRRDGTPFPVDISLAPLGLPGRPLTLAVVRDLSGRRAEWEAAAWLGAIVSSSEDAIVSMDLNGTLTTWNPGAERLLGFSADEICGRPVWRLVPEGLRADFEEQMARVRAALHIPTRDTLRLDKDGNEIEVAEALSLIREPSGAATGISAVMRDITERKGAERELRRLLVDGQRRERWLGAISEVRLSMLAGGTLEQWLALIARRAAELADADAITVSVVAEDDDSLLEVITTYGAPAERFRGRLFPIKGSAPGRVFTTGRSTVTTGPPDLHGLDDDDAGPVRAGPLLLVPITTSRGTDGALGVMRLAGRADFSPEELRVVESFGQQAGLAIELDRAQVDREQLALIGDRERIARDLHDHVIQRIFAVGMALQAASRSITDSAALDRIGESVEELDATIRDVRSTIFSLALRANERAKTSTRARILEVISMAAQGLGFQPRLHFDGPVDTKVSEELVPDVLAVVREGLSNTTRHAKASRAEVHVDVRHDLTITVTDNGIGLGDATRTSGLANLRTRAEDRGGSMTVGPGEKRGTRLVWQVPLS
jgi:PAS domain S-box-containing protein